METGSSFSDIINIEALDYLLNRFNFSKEEKNKIKSKVSLSGKINQRLEHIAQTLHENTSKDFILLNNNIKQGLPYPKNLPSGCYFILVSIGLLITKMVKNKQELYIALDTLKELTKSFSSEFAIRHLALKYPEEVENYMQQCSLDEDLDVRRFASEGLRPRLPWSFKLDRYIDKPEINYPILLNLASDNIKYVQKSVANHINDISKDNPQKALDLVAQFPKNKNSQWIINHGLRTLIKQGHQPTLKFLGYKKPKIKIKAQLNQVKISIGQSVELELKLNNLKNESVVVDYIVVYPKGGRKVFKLCKLSPKEVKTIVKRIHFKNLQTRKVQIGKHKIVLQVNGLPLKSLSLDIKH